MAHQHLALHKSVKTEGADEDPSTSNSDGSACAGGFPQEEELPQQQQVCPVSGASAAASGEVRGSPGGGCEQAEAPPAAETGPVSCSSPPSPPTEMAPAGQGDQKGSNRSCSSSEAASFSSRAPSSSSSSRAQDHEVVPLQQQAGEGEKSESSSADAALGGPSAEPQGQKQQVALTGTDLSPPEESPFTAATTNSIRVQDQQAMPLKQLAHGSSKDSSRADTAITACTKDQQQQVLGKASSATAFKSGSSHQKQVHEGKQQEPAAAAAAAGEAGPSDPGGVGRVAVAGTAAAPAPASSRGPANHAPAAAAADPWPSRAAGGRSTSSSGTSAWHYILARTAAKYQAGLGKQASFSQFQCSAQTRTSFWWPDGGVRKGTGSVEDPAAAGLDYNHELLQELKCRLRRLGYMPEFVELLAGLVHPVKEQRLAGGATAALKHAVWQKEECVLFVVPEPTVPCLNPDVLKRAWECQLRQQQAEQQEAQQLAQGDPSAE